MSDRIFSTIVFVEDEFLPIFENLNSEDVKVITYVSIAKRFIKDYFNFNEDEFENLLDSNSKLSVKYTPKQYPETLFKNLDIMDFSDIVGYTDIFLKSFENKIYKNLLKKYINYNKKYIITNINPKHFKRTNIIYINSQDDVNNFLYEFVI
jgi:Leucine-rich repeat (LRR) protein